MIVCQHLSAEDLLWAHCTEDRTESHHFVFHKEDDVTEFMFLKVQSASCSESRNELHELKLVKKRSSVFDLCVDRSVLLTSVAIFAMGTSKHEPFSDIEYPFVHLTRWRLHRAEIANVFKVFEYNGGRLVTLII